MSQREANRNHVFRCWILDVHARIPVRDRRTVGTALRRNPLRQVRDLPRRSLIGWHSVGQLDPDCWTAIQTTSNTTDLHCFSRASNKTWQILEICPCFRVAVQSVLTSLGLTCAFPRQNGHTVIRSTTRYLLIRVDRATSVLEVFSFFCSVPTQFRVVVSETTLPGPQSECCFDILSGGHGFMKLSESRCGVAVSGRIVCLYRQMLSFKIISTDPPHVGRDARIRLSSRCVARPARARSM